MSIQAIDDSSDPEPDLNLEPDLELTTGDLQHLIGEEVGVSDWLLVDQAMIDDFSTVTRSSKFYNVYVQPQAAEVFDATVANDFLVLSLLSHFGTQCFPDLLDSTISLNYGFTDIRFLSLVYAGSRVRARFTLTDVTWQSACRIKSCYHTVIEKEGREGPLLSAEWQILTILAAPASVQ